MAKPPHSSVGIKSLICIALIAASNAQHYPRNIQEVRNSANYDESRSFNVAQASQYSSSFSASGSSKSFGETVGNRFTSGNKIPVFHSSTEIKGCSNPEGCAGLKVEDGQITSQYGDQSILEGAPLDEDTGGRQFQAVVSGAADGEIPLDGPFWWMRADSPFRNAYQAYLRFKSTGVAESPSVCTPTGCTFSGPDSATAPSVHIEGTPADIKNNPYINGQFEALAESYLKSQASASQNKEFKIDISQNPFLNGQISGAGSDVKESIQEYGSTSNGNSITGSGSSSSSISSDSSSNVERSQFSTDEESGSEISAATGSGVIVTGGEVGEEGSSGSSSSSSGSEEIDVGALDQNGFDVQQQEEQEEQGEIEQNSAELNGGGELLVSCTGRNRVCVPRNQCVNGIVVGNAARPSRGSQKCRAANEVCCKVSKGNAGASGGNGVNGGNSGFESSGNTGNVNTGGFSINGAGEAQIPFQDISPPTQDTVNSINSVNSIDTSSFFSQTDTQNSFRPGSEPGQKPGIPYLPPVTEGSLLLDEVRTTKPPTTKYIPVKTRPVTKRPYNPVKTKPIVTPEPYYPPYIPPQVTNPPYIPPQTTRYIPPLTTPVRYYPPQTTPAPYYPPQTTPAPYYPPQTPAPYYPPQTTPAPYIPPYIPPVTRRPSIRRPAHTKAPAYLPPVEGSLLLDQFITTTKAPTYRTGSVLLDQSRTTFGITPTAALSGCAAALICTPEEFCSVDGFISNTSVFLTDYQKTFRVPITDCLILETSQPGKCCRDPYYTDPWPTNQLGQWIPEAFGDTGAYTPNGPAKFSPRPRPTTPSTLIKEVSRRPIITTLTPIIGSGTTNFETGSLLLSEFQDGQFGYAYGQCGLRRPGVPQGNKQKLEVDFAEIPWQAMILLKTNKSLLCGGVITRPEVVATTASCVEGIRAGDIQVKGGEWKLGVEDEPLPFQIITVRKVINHPGYRSGALANDIALLVLEAPFGLTTNIYPICLPDENETIEELYQGSSNCITTGWGKKVLQAHIPNALMHAVNLDILNEGECRQKLQNYPNLLRSFDRKSCLCGQTKNAYDNICKVDTGSALACESGNGHWVLRGLYSWDNGCDVNQQFAGFYKFDAEWYWHALGLRVSTKYTIYQNSPSFFTNEGSGIISQQVPIKGRRPSVVLPGPTVTPFPATITPRPIQPIIGNQGLGIIQVPGSEQEQGLLNVQFQGGVREQRPGYIQGQSVTSVPIIVPELPTRRPVITQRPIISTNNNFQGGITQQGSGFYQGQGVNQVIRPLPQTPAPQFPTAFIQTQTQRPQTIRPIVPVQRPISPTPGYISGQGSLITQTQGQQSEQGSGYEQSGYNVPGINSLSGVFQLPNVTPTVGSTIISTIIPNTVTPFSIASFQNQGFGFNQRPGTIQEQGLYQGSFQQPGYASTIIKGQGSTLNEGSNVITQQGTIQQFGQGKYGNKGTNVIQGQGFVKGQPQGFIQTGSGLSESTGGVIKQINQGFIPATGLSTGNSFLQGVVGGQNSGGIQGQYEYKQSVGPVVGGYQYQQEETIPENGLGYQYESKKILPTVTKVIPGQRVEYQYNTEQLLPQTFSSGGNLGYQYKAERTVVPQISGGHYKVSYQSDLNQAKPTINVQYQTKEFGKPPSSGSYVINGQIPTIIPPGVSQFGLKDAFALNNQAQASDINCECLDDYV